MSFNLKTILLLLVIFLLGTNIAVIVVYQRHLIAEKVEFQKRIEVPNNQFGKFFKEELQLNAEQLEQFKVFRRTYNRSANRVLSEMHSIRVEMANQLNTIHPNREELDQLAVALGKKHQELKGLTFDYYFNMQSILNDDQQQKLVVVFQSMLTQEGDVKTPRQGGQGQGRRNGRQSGNDSLQNPHRNY